MGLTHRASLQKIKDTDGIYVSHSGYGPHSVLKMIYNSLGKSVIQYGITVYGHCAKYLQRKVETLQKQIFRRMGHQIKKRSDLIDDIRKEIGVFYFSDQLKYDIITKFFLTNYHKIEIIKERTLRPNRNYFEPLIKSKYGEATRNYYVPKLFNQLPEELIECKYPHAMKKMARIWISEQKN